MDMNERVPGQQVGFSSERSVTRTPNGEFDNVIEVGREYWVIRNMPGNEISGRWHTKEEALRHGLPGDVLYHLHVVERRVLDMVIPATKSDVSVPGETS